MSPRITRRPALRPLLSMLAIISLGAMSAAPAATAGETLVRDDLDAVFQEHGVTGTFVLYDVAEDRLTLVNAKRAETRFVPASTFKIANSLIALETGAVKDEAEVIPYGGKPQPFKVWERNMSMREAIVISNVPVYQELARRVGLDQYHHWLARLGYGNQETGSQVDRFWLDGPLEISAVEQVKFLSALAQGKLDASAGAQEFVRDILRLESRDGISLYGKTGWQFSREPQLGWWVGWVERDGKIFAFALNIDMAGKADIPKRTTIGKALLEKLGVM